MIQTRRALFLSVTENKQTQLGVTGQKNENWRQLWSCMLGKKIKSHLQVTVALVPEWFRNKKIWATEQTKQLFSGAEPSSLLAPCCWNTVQNERKRISNTTIYTALHRTDWVMSHKCQILTLPKSAPILFFLSTSIFKNGRNETTWKDIWLFLSLDKQHWSSTYEHGFHVPSAFGYSGSVQLKLSLGIH